MPAVFDGRLVGQIVDVLEAVVDPDGQLIAERWEHIGSGASRNCGHLNCPRDTGGADSYRTLRGREGLSCRPVGR